MKGKWNSHFFKNSNPLVLELACGKGEYTVGLAKKYPKQNFIGIDLKGNRLWRGAKTALEEKIQNAAFLRSRIDFIEKAFEQNEVSEIWITFPDPQPKKENKRLTSPLFLMRYKNVLPKNGIIHLKTDSRELYDFTLEVIASGKHTLLESTEDLYANLDSDSKVDAASQQTYYEKIFTKLGKKICYVKFTLNNAETQ